MTTRAFWTAVFSEDGTPSVKRVTLSTTLVVWLFLIVLNDFTGRKIDPTFQEQLFTGLMAFASLVFGGNIVTMIGKVQTTRSLNNASVGQPSPAPDKPVIVTPGAATVTQ